MKTTISLSAPADVETESLVAVVLDQATSTSGDTNKKPELKIAATDPAYQSADSDLLSSCEFA